MIMQNANFGKKAQLKIQQMIFMLVAVTLFFILIGMFFLVIMVSNIEESAETIRENNALTLVSKIANSPEFSCGEVYASSVACIDLDKVMALKENIDKYKMGLQDKTFWGMKANIEIRKIYPDASEEECTAGNYPDCSVVNLFGEPITAPYSNFALLCRKAQGEDVYDKCEIGKIAVDYEYEE